MCNEHLIRQYKCNVPSNTVTLDYIALGGPTSTPEGDVVATCPADLVRRDVGKRSCLVCRLLGARGARCQQLVGKMSDV
jgi:hypothetical protein